MNLLSMHLIESLSKESGMPTINDKNNRLLARGVISRVELCGCNGVHVTIGTVTVRLPPGAFEDLHTTISEARCQLTSLADPGNITLC